MDASSSQEQRCPCTLLLHCIHHWWEREIFHSVVVKKTHIHTCTLCCWPSWPWRQRWCHPPCPDEKCPWGQWGWQHMTVTFIHAQGYLNSALMSMSTSKCHSNITKFYFYYFLLFIFIFVQSFPHLFNLFLRCFNSIRKKIFLFF